MSDGFINGMGPGIQIVHHDDHGMPTSISIVVKPCAASGDHGIACYVFDDGDTLLCKACGTARLNEAARITRLSRLSPKHQEWLAAKGIHDWPATVQRTT